MNLSKYLISESIKSTQLDKAYNLISEILRKRKIYTYSSAKQVEIDGTSYIGFMCTNDKNQGAMFLWKLGNIADVESIIFIDDVVRAQNAWESDKSATFNLEVKAKGASTTKMVNLLTQVLTGKIAMDQKSMEKYIHTAKLFESKDNLDDLLKRKQQLYNKIRNLEKKHSTVDQSMRDELADIQMQITGIRAKIKTNVKVSLQPDPEVERWEAWLVKEIEAYPEERFDDMLAAVEKVLKGIVPLCLLCGAPGIGKTYRVMQYLKKKGLRLGNGYNLFKGSTTAASLFINLANTRRKDEIMVYDDCDDIFKDPDCINIMKAAYDSSEERWVSWNTSRPIIAQDQYLATLEPDFYQLIQKGKIELWAYPNQFLYEGGGIIITNFKAGSIDTAIKNRAAVVDLSFTNKESIGIIESIMDNINPSTLTKECKQKALNYINELIDMNAPIAISVRTFVQACEEYMLEGASERAIRRRIALNLKLQADKATGRADRKY